MIIIIDFYSWINYMLSYYVLYHLGLEFQFLVTWESDTKYRTWHLFSLSDDAIQYKLLASIMILIIDLDNLF